MAYYYYCNNINNDINISNNIIEIIMILLMK